MVWRDAARGGRCALGGAASVAHAPPRRSGHRARFRIRQPARGPEYRAMRARARCSEWCESRVSRAIRESNTLYTPSGSHAACRLEPGRSEGLSRSARLERLFITNAGASARSASRPRGGGPQQPGQQLAVQHSVRARVGVWRKEQLRWWLTMRRARLHLPALRSARAPCPDTASRAWAPDVPGSCLYSLRAAGACE